MANENVRRHLSDAELLLAVEMVEQSATHRHVKVLCTKAWNLFQEYGTPIRRHGGGRQGEILAAEVPFLEIQARRNASGVNVSTQTIRTRLHGSGLLLRRPHIRILLSRNH